MGESPKQAFQLSFNRFLRVGFQGSRVTSNGGLILVRELDERLGFSELIDEHLTDSRANNARFSFADLLRQSVYSRLAGYEDVNDAERLSQDPTFRLIGSEKTWERGAALTSRLQTFETEMLAKVENFVGLARINRELIGKVEAFQWHYRAVLDMDATEIPVYGEQEQSAYNGHFESTCYHPLLLFNRDGDCLAAQLRPGNVHSAEGWEKLLLPEIDRQQRMGKEIAFRADAAFAKPEVYEALEERGWPEPPKRPAQAPNRPALCPQQAASPSANAMWVFPVPEFPKARMFSLRSMNSPRASSSTKALFKIVGGGCGGHLRRRQVRIVLQVQPRRQVRIVLQVQPRRPLLDPAQQQMLDRVRPDRPQPQGVLD